MAPKLSRVTLTATPTSCLVGERIPLSAVAYDASGRVMAVPITFVADPATKGDVEILGTGKAQVTALLSGYCTITATATKGGYVAEKAFRLTFKDAPTPPPTVARVDVTFSPTTAKVGDTVTATAMPRDAAGSPVAGKTVTWTTADPACATVDATGHVTACAASTVAIRATVDGVAGSAALTITAPVVVGGGAVPVKIGRAASGSGETFCVGPIALRRGRLTLAQFRAGRGVLRIDGVETAFAADVPDAPAAFHPNGDMALVRAQIRRTLTKGTPLTRVVFDCTAQRTLPLLPMEDPTPALRSTAGATVYDRGIPGFIIGADPAENCDSGQFGTVRPASEDPADLPWLADAVAAYTKFEPTTARTWDGTLGAWYATGQGVGSGGTNGLAVYEPFAEYWDAFARTGNTDYAERAVALWCAWTVNYLAPLNGGSTEPVAMPRSWRMAYLFLGDSLAQQALSFFASFLAPGRDAEKWAGVAVNYGVGRFGARALESMALGLGTDPGMYPKDGVPGTYTPAHLADVLARSLNASGIALPILAQSPNERPAWTTELAGWGGDLTMQIRFDSNYGGVLYHYGFQHAIYTNALIEWHDGIDPHPLIRDRVCAQVLAWMRRYRYVGAGKAAMIGERFLFDSTNPESPAFDLNGFFVRPFYRAARWLAERGDGTTARAVRVIGDELWHPLVLAHTGYDSSAYGSGKNGPDWWYAMPKTWHESMHGLFRNLGERALATAAGA